MAVTFYDNLPINENIVLEWPLTEGIGTAVHDQSKSGSIGELLTGGLPVFWSASAFYGIYLFEAWNQYVNCPAADTTNLNFTSGDYSLACWINWADVGFSEIIMGKYVLNTSGWEVYLTKVGAIDYMTVRQHHPGVTPRTGSFSIGWNESTLWLFGFTRTGTTCQHYRNGVAVATTSDVLIDPGSSVGNDLRLGCRYTEDSNWYNGYIGRPRAWSRALTADEHRQLYSQGNAQ